jgi:hypothetical protein
MTPTKTNEPQPTPKAALAGAHGSAKYKPDWTVFSELYMTERGFYPNQRDRMHRELFHWFIQGAHSEMKGRLRQSPNAPGELPGAKNQDA